MMTQITPAKKQSRNKSVEIKATDLNVPGCIPLAACMSGRGTNKPRRIKSMPSGKRMDFFGGAAFGVGGGVCVCVFIVCVVGLTTQAQPQPRAARPAME